MTKNCEILLVENWKNHILLIKNCNKLKLLMYLLFIWGGTHGCGRGEIHNEGRLKEWALKWQQVKRVTFGPKKVEISGPTPSNSSSYGFPPKTRDFRAHSEMVSNKRVRSLRGRLTGVEGWEGGEQCWAQICYSLPVTVTSYKLLTQSYWRTSLGKLHVTHKLLL
jgi:hypothetical protein